MKLTAISQKTAGAHLFNLIRSDDSHIISVAQVANIEIPVYDKSCGVVLDLSFPAWAISLLVSRIQEIGAKFVAVKYLVDAGTNYSVIVTSSDTGWPRGELIFFKSEQAIE